jgi:hypothetical protein
VTRKVVAAVVGVACLAIVVAFQLTRPTESVSNPRVFVPSPRFFQEFSPSYRTSIADLYWLGIVQYYGEHIEGDRRLDSLPAMLDVVTRLSPRFIEPYLFSTFALADAGKTQQAYDVLQRGIKANPDDWQLPFQLGTLIYWNGGRTEDKAREAAKWFEIASHVPGRPDFVPRLAAGMLQRGGERDKAVLMWGQIYSQGDKYQRKTAVERLEAILPKQKEARMKAVAPLYKTMPKKDFESLIAELFASYVD